MHTAVGKTSTLSVDPHDTIAVVKGKLRAKTNVPPHLQQLLFQGRKLDRDEATLLSYHVQNWAKILLLPQKAEADTCEIPIKTLSGKSFSVQAKLSDKVEDVCVKIEKKEGIPLEQQQLIYGGKVLDWNTTLDEYSIQQGSALHVVSALSQRRVFFKFPASPWTKVSTVPATVLLTDTVGNLVKKIAEKFKIPIDCQQIYFTGKRLEKDQPLSHYSIVSGSVIDIQVLVPVQKQVVFIKTPAGQQIKVEYLPGDYIASIKQKIYSEMGFEPNRQLLLLAGKPLEDAMTVNSYNLSNETTLHLLVHAESTDVVESGELAEIFVRTLAGKVMSLRVGMSDTMGDIKAKIQRTEGVACGQQRLLLKGKPLDDSVILRDYNIETESTFYLALMPSLLIDDGNSLQTNSTRSRQIRDATATPKYLYVRNLLGKTISIGFHPSDTIRTLKTKISAKEGIPVDHQKLIFHGRNLDDEEIVERCNIEQESNLQLALTIPGEEKLCSVFIRILTGKLLTVELPCSAKVIELKERVHTLEGLPPAQQKLVLDGVELADEATLDSYHLSMHTTLQLMIAIPEENTSRDIFITTPLGKIVTINVSLGESVREVKAKISKKEGILPAQQKLIFRGKELEDNRLLADCGIERESHLVMIQHLELGTVSVRMPFGEILSIGLQPGDTIATVKHAIQQLQGVPLSRQDLLGGDRMSLRDNATASVGDVISMALRPVSISVLVSQYSPSARVKVISVDNIKTVDDIQHIVATSLDIPRNIPRNRLKFFHNGKILTIDNCLCIEPGDVVILGK